MQRKYTAWGMAGVALTFQAGACLSTPYGGSSTASVGATDTLATGAQGPATTEPGVLTVTTVATAIVSTMATSTSTVTATGVVTGVISGTLTATATVTYVQTLTYSETATATSTFTATMTVAQPTSVTPGTTTAIQTGVATSTTSSTATSTKTSITGTATQPTSGTVTGTATVGTTTQTTVGTATTTTRGTTTSPPPSTQTASGTGTGGTTTQTGVGTRTQTTSGTGAGTATPTSTAMATATATAVTIDTAAYPARVENPYDGAKGYVNPEWKAKAEAESGGSRVSSNPTGVWLDRIAAIAGSSTSMGLRAHLDAAIAQSAGYAQFVIYDLPGRDCAALASNGELGPTDIDRYKTEYIDPIVAIMADVKYANLRIINIIEIDSLPNLVTNTGGTATATAACETMKSNGNYATGIAYALSRLHIIPNTYNYVDAAHHGWIGWDDNFGATADLMATTVKGATGGFDTVNGFITNTANYSALVEPYITVTETTRQSKWIDWNRYVDEQSFAIAFRNRLISAGFKSTIGMLIDTSRNGWGGPSRPTVLSTATDVNTMIDQSRIDRRIHSGNWCNQSGAGLGERPRSVGKDGIHAYVWIKPPGESDGASSEIANDQGKGFDRMCDPTYAGNARNGNNQTGALANAPLSGAWFSAQFQELLKNAYPTLE